MRKTALFFFFLIFTFSEGMTLLAESTATVLSVRGRAQVRAEGAEEWQAIVRETVIRENDSIRTGSDTYLELDLDGAGKVTIISPAVIKFKTFNKTISGSPQIGLRISSGKYRFVIDKEKNPVFVAETKDARLAVKGTDFLLDAGLEKSGLYVLTGLVSLNNVFQTGTPVDVPPGQFSEVSRDLSPTKTAAIPEGIYREWNLPMPPIAKVSDDLVIPKSNTGGAAANTNVVPPAASNLAASNTSASNKNTTNTNAKPKPVFEKEPIEPIFPPFPWKFTMKNQLQLGYVFEPTNKSPYGYTTVSIAGLSLSNFNHWLSLTWIPEFNYGPFGIGLYLPVTFGARDQFYLPTMWYNASEWDFQSGDSDLLVKIAFLQFKIWRFSFRYGGFPSLTWGSGHLLNEFNNMMDFPTKRVNGLLLGYEDPNWGMKAQFFNGDLSQQLIGGARFEVKPVRMFTPPSKRKDPSLFGGLTVGFSYVNLDSPIKASLTNFMPSYFTTNNADGTTATNVSNATTNASAYSNLISYSNITHSIDGVGMDVTLPIGNDFFSITPFLNWGSIAYHSNTVSSVIGPGFSAGARGNLTLIKFRADAYYNFNGFVPGYFDSFNLYDGQRVDKIIDLLQNTNTNNVGFLASAGVNFGKVGFLQATFEEYYEATTLARVRNKLQAELVINKGVIKFGYGRAYYIRKNFLLTDLTANLFDASTLVGAEAHIKILGPLELIAQYTLSFANGTSQPTGNLDVRVSFDFNALAPPTAPKTP